METDRIGNPGKPGQNATCAGLGSSRRLWVARRVERYVSNTASFVLCAARRVKDHHHMPNNSPRLKNICVRQVVIDKWFPPNYTILYYAMLYYTILYDTYYNDTSETCPSFLRRGELGAGGSRDAAHRAEPENRT